MMDIEPVSLDGLKGIPWSGLFGGDMLFFVRRSELRAWDQDIDYRETYCIKSEKMPVVVDLKTVDRLMTVLSEHVPDLLEQVEGASIDALINRIADWLSGNGEQQTEVLDCRKALPDVPPGSPPFRVSATLHGE